MSPIDRSATYRSFSAYVQWSKYVVNYCQSLSHSRMELETMDVAKYFHTMRAPSHVIGYYYSTIYHSW